MPWLSMHGGPQWRYVEGREISTGGDSRIAGMTNEELQRELDAR